MATLKIDSIWTRVRTSDSELQSLQSEIPSHTTNRRNVINVRTHSGRQTLIM